MGIPSPFPLAGALRLVTLALAAIVSASCQGELIGPRTKGAIDLHVATTGGDVDLDGYIAILDGSTQVSVGANATTRLTLLDVGTHSLGLTGLTSNCAVVGDNPVTVTVEAGVIVLVPFEVACTVTGLWIVISTTGVDLPEGFDITVNGTSTTAVPSNSSALISRLPPGDHTVALGVDAYCTVAPPHPATVPLASGETVAVIFAVTCGARTASIAVSTASSGFDLPASVFDVLVDGSLVGSIPAHGSMVIDGLGAGDHAVELANVPRNCTVTGNPASVTLAVGGVPRDTAEVAFEAACVAGASIAVSAATSGVDRARSDYSVLVDGVAMGGVPPDGSAVFDGFLAGDHSVELSGLPANCAVVSENPVDVTVTTDALPRDTADVAFGVDCAKAWQLAFTRPVPESCVPFGWGVTCGPAGTAIYVSRADGSDTTFFAWGRGAAWSGDGMRLAFEGCTWTVDYDYYDYYDPVERCEPSGLRTVSTETQDTTQVTSGAGDADPAWRPDGGKIAFSRQGRLYTVNPDGSAPAPIPVPTLSAAYHPDWSPDGSAIVFTCEIQPGNADICVVNADGTGLLRLTSDSGREARPAWKPDGTAIIYSASPFGGSTDLALISPGGTELGTLAPGVGAMHPTWSPDGAAIAFVGVACNLYSGCRALGLFRISADGTALTQLTSGPDDGPSWRP